MKDEKDSIKELRSQKQKLEIALAQAQLEMIRMEALLESIEEQLEVHNNGRRNELLNAQRSKVNRG